MQGAADLTKRRQMLQKQKDALLGLQSSHDMFRPSQSMLGATSPTHLASSSTGRLSRPSTFSQTAPHCDVDVPPQRSNGGRTEFGGIAKAGADLSSNVLHSELLGDDDYVLDIYGFVENRNESNAAAGSAMRSKAGGSITDKNSPLSFQLNLRDDYASAFRCVTALKFHTKFDDVVLSSHSERTDGKIDAPQGTVAIWGLDGGRGALQRSLMAHAPVTALELPSISPTLVVGGTSGGNIVMWDIRVKTSLPVTSFGGDPCDVNTSHGRQAVTAVKTTKSPSPILFSSSVSGYLYTWSLSKPDYPVSHTIVQDRSGAAELMFSCFDFPRGTQLSIDGSASSTSRTRLFAGAYDGNVYRLNASESSWNADENIGSHAATVTAVSPHPSGNRVAFLDDVVVSSSSDWTIRLWLFRKGQAVQELACYDLVANGAINDVEWSSQHPTIFCAGDEAGVLSLFDISGQIVPDGAPYELRSPERTEGAITRVQWGNNSKNICTGDVNGSISLWACGNAFAGLPNSDWTAQYLKAKSLRDPP